MTLFHNMWRKVNEWLERKISLIGQANLPPNTDYDGGIGDEPLIRPSDHLDNDRENY